MRQAVAHLLVMLSPFVPHIADELWTSLGGAGMLLDHAWPEFDAAWAEKVEVTIAVQVLGKVRATLTVAIDSPQEEVQSAAMAEVNVAKHIEGKPIKKVIYVPNKILNLIV